MFGKGNFTYLDVFIAFLTIIGPGFWFILLPPLTYYFLALLSGIVVVHIVHFGIAWCNYRYRLLPFLQWSVSEMPVRGLEFINIRTGQGTEHVLNNLVFVAERRDFVSRVKNIVGVLRVERLGDEEMEGPPKTEEDKQRREEIGVLTKLGNDYEIKDVVVVPDERDEGIATELMEYARLRHLSQIYRKFYLGDFMYLPVYKSPV